MALVPLIAGALRGYAAVRAAEEISKDLESEPLASNWLNRVTYDHTSGTMFVYCADGFVGEYQVSYQEFEAFKDAPSPGAHFLAVTRGG